MYQKIQFKNQPPLFTLLLPSHCPSTQPRCSTESSLNAPHIFGCSGTSEKKKSQTPSPQRSCNIIEKTNSTFDHSGVQKPKKKYFAKVTPFCLEVNDAHLVQILSEQKENKKDTKGNVDAIEQISFRGITNRASLIGMLEEMSEKLLGMWDCLDNADFVVKSASPKTFCELHLNQYTELIEELEFHKSAVRRHIDETQVQVSVALQCLTKRLGISSPAHSQYGLHLLDLQSLLVRQIFCVLKFNDVVKKTSRAKRGRPQDQGLVCRAKSR